MSTNQIIRFAKEICTDLNAALSREWLETNGLGGYASSTINGANSRRYHGLLVAAIKPPVDRMVLLSKLDETIIIANKNGPERIELGSNLYPGVVHPEGYRLLEEFRLDPWPTWRWQAGGIQIEKSLCLISGEDTLLVEYRVTGGTISMEILPLIAFRDYHATAHANNGLNREIQQTSDSVIAIRPYADVPPLHFRCAGATVTQTGEWFYRFQYPREQERGLNFEEDLFQPFVYEVALTPERPVRLAVSLQPETRDLDQLFEAERSRRSAAFSELAPALRRAAGQFIAARGTDSTVLAGYHWFTDWGRDTMISIPGLAIETGQPAMMKPVLRAFIPWIFQGVLPNRFPDAGEKPEYNSTDATLWFVDAVRSYFEATGDDDFVQNECYAALKEIVAWRERGTLHGIRVDTDGLLTGGETGVQLTWMDAKVNGRVITERAGKPVEIQALWFNALCVIRETAARGGDHVFAQHCLELAERARVSFRDQFWNATENCLFDVVMSNGGGDNQRDGAIRPNQVFALSLTHRILDPDRGASIMEVVKRELLTPFGLRTLSPRDSRYQGVYQGDQESRDSAYHQGTVWPWLLGPYVRAMFAVFGRSPETIAEAKRLLEPFRAHLLEAGIGQISEIFDGDAPHAPKGCIAQAWSVAQLLQIIRLI